MKLALFLFGLFLSSQLSSAHSQSKKADAGLFSDDAILEFKISGKLRDLFNDRDENSSYHPISLSYLDKDSATITIPLEARTRGHFRKLPENCVYPPILLNFSSKNTPAHCIFSGEDKLKLVMPCQGDEFVVREWMVYKLYNLVSEKSFKARLVRVELDDTEKKKKVKPFYAILLEDDKSLAHRNKMVVADKTMLRMEQMEVKSFLKMAVFEFLIGNTDWSVQYLQNIKMIARDSAAMPYAVPYDFDHSGMVSAPYAHPAEELLMQSVRERRYRGYCVPEMTEFKEAIAYFNQLKESIYKLYSGSTLLSDRYKKATLEYFDEFYATINNEKKARTAFTYPCDKNGTGNIIIQGMKKNQ